ncbi:Regulation of nuclear pre-mRNA domain-containing protein 1A [Willisornis vidua]|uniref:Regulation of nuclear pre-mRNA domain-containing protein 1A n=1 Tax=Willisornis vidua TaxID=1566151 RepID=A0ABQ9D5U4_9PASS|nr:Regulation of nuclear pre-mRNA domain-containing protein 1A [Willisornis vidua]
MPKRINDDPDPNNLKSSLVSLLSVNSTPDFNLLDRFINHSFAGKSDGLIAKYLDPISGTLTKAALTTHGSLNYRAPVDDCMLARETKTEHTTPDVVESVRSKAKPNRKLTFLYLANDVIQNSKRKGPEFTKDFAPVIVEAFKHVSSESDESCKKHLGRVLSIWEERSVYENDVLEQLRQALYGDRKVRKRTYEQIKVDENNCSPRSSPPDPPQTTDLIRALQELENAASGDAAVHQRIASLPLEVQDVSLLDRITDKESGEQLSKMVDDACMLLADYNGRLAAEIDDRKQLTRMLSDFLRCQKEFLAEKEHKLELLLQVVDMDLSSNDVTIH